MVSKNKSKSVAAPKASNSSKKPNLPDGLNYKVLRHMVIPTVIVYYACQKDPWDRQPTLLCNEISMILKSVGMDFKVHPKGPIYKNVNTYIFLQLLSLFIQTSRLLSALQTAGKQS